MGGIRDWTSEGVIVLSGGEGTVEHRIERDGTVKFRGLVTKTADYAVPISVLFPADAVPFGNGPWYFDWTGAVDVNLNTYVSGPQFAGAVYNFPGYVLDFSHFAWMGTPLPDPYSEHSLESIMSGLGDQLRAVMGLRVYDFPSKHVEPPAAVLSLPETPYDVTLGGRADEWTFPLWLLVSKADDKAAYKEMVPYLEAEGERSIRAAIEADRTLGGSCDTCAVVNARPQFASVGGVEFLAVEFTVEVFT